MQNRERFIEGGSREKINCVFSNPTIPQHEEAGAGMRKAKDAEEHGQRQIDHSGIVDG